MIRHMLHRSFLMPSWLYVTYSHDEEKVASMLAALDESLAIVAPTPLEAAQGPQQGFARLV
jgi:hypothetical protein